MTHRIAALIFAAVLSAPACAADRLVSPEVLPDRRVTFRVRAPKALEVTLGLSGAASTSMVRDADGVWSATTGPLEPDYYSYSFNIDGVTFTDPSNPATIPNFIWPGSVVHIPGPPGLPWELNDVPHGALHHHFYHSGVVGDDRDFYVYTPAGYDPRVERRYPVLVLLHGFSDDASGWTAVGRAHVILDNLIALREAKPMIVVMPLGYGAPEVLSFSRTGPRDPAVGRRNVERFREALFKEVMPRVETAYRLAPGRASRAIAGLSMGGAESLEVGLNALDRFAWVGAFSSGGGIFEGAIGDHFPGLDAKANARLKLLWISCGTDDRLIEGNRKLIAWLTGQQIHHTAVETPGAHTWMVWRRNLVAFLPLLFR